MLARGIIGLLRSSISRNWWACWQCGFRSHFGSGMGLAHPGEESKRLSLEPSVFKGSERRLHPPGAVLKWLAPLHCPLALAPRPRRVSTVFSPLKWGPFGWACVRRTNFTPSLCRRSRGAVQWGRPCSRPSPTCGDRNADGDDQDTGREDGEAGESGRAQSLVLPARKGGHAACRAGP